MSAETLECQSGSNDGNQARREGVMSSQEDLKAIQLFAEFDDDDFDAFVEATDRRSVPADHVFFGMPANIPVDLWETVTLVIVTCAFARHRTPTPTDPDGTASPVIVRSLT